MSPSASWGSAGAGLGSEHRRNSPPFFDTLPLVYPANSWWVPAPQQGGAQAWDVTPIVKNWVGGVWGQSGLYVGQSPIVDRIPTWNGQQWDNQSQVTSYCSLEQSGGSIDLAPALHVDYR